MLECADVIQRIEVKAGFKTDESGRKWLSVEHVKSMAPWEGKSGCPAIQKAGKQETTSKPELPLTDENPLNKLDLESWGRSFWQEVKNTFVKTSQPDEKEGLFK